MGQEIQVPFTVPDYDFFCLIIDQQTRKMETVNMELKKKPGMCGH